MRVIRRFIHTASLCIAALSVPCLIVMSLVYFSPFHHPAPIDKAQAAVKIFNIEKTAKPKPKIKKEKKNKMSIALDICSSVRNQLAIDTITPATNNAWIYQAIWTYNFTASNSMPILGGGTQAFQKSLNWQAG